MQADLVLYLYHQFTEFVAMRAKVRSVLPRIARTVDSSLLRIGHSLAKPFFMKLIC
jgi:hypothetical protein